MEYETHGEFRVPKTKRGSVGGSSSRSTRSRSRGRQTATEAFSKSLMRSLGTTVGRLLRNVLTGRRR